MVEILIENPILLLVVVAALGYLLGNVRVRGSSLGVSAVLFAGLAVGALHPDLKLPEFATYLGLVLFVYTIGLSSGPGFFASFRRKGVRDNALVVSLLLVAAGLAAGAHYVLGLSAPVTAGLYAGSLTNTPTLASVIETLQAGGAAEALRNAPVVGYSIAYPVGVIGMIVAVFAAQRLWKVDYDAEARHLRDLAPTTKTLQSRTVRVTQPEATAEPVAGFVRRLGYDVFVGRVRRRNGDLFLADAATRLDVGDLVTVVGAPDVMDRVTEALGEESEEHLALDRSTFDARRIFVSDPRVVGHRLGDLNLWGRYGAIVTRVRRGDVEWVAHPETVIEPGDRVRVVARPEHMPAVSAFFGDSYRALSEINLLTFSLGLTMGLLVGMIPVPLPGGITFRLGLAGGPLVVGLVLGRLGRTGSFVWHMPYSGNLLLRQFGLVLFFAGVGTRAGHAFLETLTQSGGLAILGAGAVVTCVTALAMLWIGHRVLRIPMSLLAGMLAGLQTQPAVLSYALDQSRNDLPNIGYATVYPLATIAKILFAQLLLALL